LKCLRAWLKFEFHPDILAQISFQYAELTKLIFSLTPELCKYQGSCVSHLIISTAGTHVNPAMETAKRDIGMRVIALIPYIQPAIQNKNKPMIECFQLIFTNLGMMYMEKILADPENEIFGVLLSLLAYNKGKIRFMCNFWKKFFKFIYQIKDEKIREAKIIQFEKIFKQALSITIQLLQIPEETFLLLNKTAILDEQFSDLVENRHDYNKIIKYIGGCLGVKTFWSLISEKFKTDISGISTNPMSVSHWAQLEATLAALGPAFLSIFIFLFLLESEPHDMLEIQDLLIMILSMTKDSIQLQRSIIEIISSVSSNLAAVEPIFKQALKHLFECLEIPLLKDQASDVLLDMLDHNKAFLAENSLLQDLLTSIFFIKN